MGYSRFCAHAVGAFVEAETCLWLVERVADDSPKVNWRSRLSVPVPRRSEKVLSLRGLSQTKSTAWRAFHFARATTRRIEPSGHSRQHELECFDWFKYHSSYLSRASWASPPCYNPILSILLRHNNLCIRKILHWSFSKWWNYL